jgi:MoaA/NifB/PqqE/SkfB family radical SAM enzyme
MCSSHPTKLHFHITSKCPYRCRHCCADAGTDPRNLELRFGEIVDLIDHAAAFGMTTFEISGGEPTVLAKPRLVSVVRHAARNGFQCTLSTNGYRLTRAYAAELSRVGLSTVKFSLYGTTPETNDDFTRYPGSFQLTIRGIEAAKRAGMHVGVHCVVTPRSVQEMRALPDLLDSYDVDVVQLGAVVPSGRGATAGEYVFSETARARAIAMFEQVFSNRLYRRYFFTIALFPEPQTYPFDGRFCNYLVDRLVVNTQGTVIPCCILPQNLQSVLGSLVTERLSNVYTDQRLSCDPVLHWLKRGHAAMRAKLGYDRWSHSLCTLCFDMLSRLKATWDARK